jgi:hypothetical protein
MAKRATQAEIEEARRATAERDKINPRIARAHYEQDSGLLVLEMVSGATVSVPARSLQDLRDADEKQLADVHPEENGNAIFWDALDVQMSTITLLQLIFRTQALSEHARRQSTPLPAAA